MNVVYVIGIIVLLWISFNLHHKLKRRNKIICIVESNCTGCRHCIKKCPRHVLEIAENEIGIHAVVKYPDRCTACGDCLGKCRFNAIKLIERV
ncbi:MAG: 4Fe-4S dicluster domain-containing protein [Dysgonamonadaceae bacterium]|jgi:NAD-dependent dihydropyrimidine dehydrogenase PreA subunit|nr:4Fe-4S dicluster domain-containing protein [Dysgonamonadaceae bacterium]